VKAPIRCRQRGCGYELAQVDNVAGQLFLSPKWRPTKDGECLELPPNEVKRIRATVKAVRSGQSDAIAVERMRPPAYSPEAEAKAFRRNEVHRPPLLLWNRIVRDGDVMRLICPYCATKNVLDAAKLTDLTNAVP